jgi:hypothetical protein
MTPARNLLIALAVAGAGVSFAPAALAGHLECDHTPVPNGVRACRDGSIPMYVADPLAPPQPRATGGGSLFGLWKTNVSSATWTGAPDAWGYAVQHSAAGAVAGGLLIKPDHTFVWNSAYCVRNQGWTASGDRERPITLHCIERGKPKAWRVGFDNRYPGQIVIFDEWGVSYNGRR